MSRQNQIEEMAKDLQKSEHWCFNEHSIDFEIDRKKTAENLYNAGYRKQSEVVRCKECKHFYQDGNVNVCRHWNCHSTEEDAYCSYAKMKGGE